MKGKKNINFIKLNSFKLNKKKRKTLTFRKHSMKQKKKVVVNKRNNKKIKKNELLKN